VFVFPVRSSDLYPMPASALRRPAVEKKVKSRPRHASGAMLNLRKQREDVTQALKTLTKEMKKAPHHTRSHSLHLSPVIVFSMVHAQLHDGVRAGKSASLASHLSRTRVGHSMDECPGEQKAQTLDEAFGSVGLG